MSTLEKKGSDCFHPEKTKASDGTHGLLPKSEVTTRAEQSKDLVNPLEGTRQLGDHSRASDHLLNTFLGIHASELAKTED
jgi:hypothetical protein